MEKNKTKKTKNTSNIKKSAEKVVEKIKEVETKIVEKELKPTERKTGLFKIITFILLGMVLATWIFSASYFNEGNLAELGMQNIGFFDYFSLLFSSLTFTYFFQIFILLVAVGALYGVLEKTGKYRAWIEKIANKFNGRELYFLIGCSFVIALLTSVFDYGFNLFIFFPLIISIILAMGYDKVTAFLATFGAVLIGTIGSTLAYNTAGVISDILTIKLANGIYYKLALLALSYAALIFYFSKVKPNRLLNLNTHDLFKGEKTSNKYSVASIIVVFSILFVLLVVACTNWKSSFNVSVFSDFHETVTNFSPKLPYLHITSEGIDTGSEEVSIFAKLFGTSSALGEWNYAEMAIVTFFAAILLGLLYRIKGIFACMYDGAKKMFKPALMVLFVYCVIYFAGNQMFYPTIANLILGITEKFTVIFSSITMALGSALHIDMLYVANYVVPQIAAKDANSTVIALIAQSIYGVTMFVSPTSAILVLGLSYLEIPYKHWVKKTWKLILSLLVISLVILLIANYI